MDNILAIVLSSAVLTTIITKIFNDHDRKKDYLIEEAKERRNELRNVSRKLGNVEKYDKHIKRFKAVSECIWNLFFKWR